jgi:hypothetical protein
MTADPTTPAGPNASMSTSDLVSQAAEQISVLVRDELVLAKTELVAKGKRAGLGGGLFGGAAMLAVYGVGLLIVLAVVALDLVWPLWLAVLAVAVIVFAAPGITALLGKRELATVPPPLPTEAQASITADIATLKNAIAEGRS